MSTSAKTGGVVEASLAAAALDGIEQRLGPYLEGRTYPTEIATTFNYVLFDEFRKSRAIDGGANDLKPVFVGQYFVDPKNPAQTRVFCHQGTEACSPIPITTGVIGRAVRTGEDQFVPDVAQDPLHIGCDPDMEGTEIVLVSWSKPYSTGQSQGQCVPLGVLDIDLNVKHALGTAEVSRLRRIWDVFGRLIFAGEAQFQPTGGVCAKHPEREREQEAT